MTDVIVSKQLDFKWSLSVVFAIVCLTFGEIAQLIFALFIFLLCFCSSASLLDHKYLLAVMCVNNCKYTLMWSLSPLLFC